MCDCIDMANEKLAKRNTVLDVPVFIGSGTVQTQGVRVATKKLDSNKKEGPVKLLATFCPFCGEQYKQ